MPVNTPKRISGGAPTHQIIDPGTVLPYTVNAGWGTATLTLTVTADAVIEIHQYNGADKFWEIKTLAQLHAVPDKGKMSDGFDPANLTTAASPHTIQLDVYGVETRIILVSGTATIAGTLFEYPISYGAGGGALSSAEVTAANRSATPILQTTYNLSTPSTGTDWFRLVNEPAVYVALKNTSATDLHYRLFGTTTYSTLVPSAREEIPVTDNAQEIQVRRADIGSVQVPFEVSVYGWR